MENVNEVFVRKFIRVYRCIISYYWLLILTIMARVSGTIVIIFALLSSTFVATFRDKRRIVSPVF